MTTGVMIPNDYTVRRLQWQMCEPSQLLRFMGGYEIAREAWLRDEPYKEIALALAIEREERDRQVAALSIANEFADFDLTG